MIRDDVGFRAGKHRHVRAGVAFLDSVKFLKYGFNIFRFINRE